MQKDSNTHVLVTGASGFVGRGLVRHLISAGNDVTALVRKHDSSLDEKARQIQIADLSSLVSGEMPAELTACLANMNTVIHTAARAHVLKESSDDPVTAFRKSNVDTTLALARLAATAGVSRFIFLSSIGVNGNLTKSSLHPDKPERFRETDEPAPHDLYAQSKWQAEQGLMQIARETGLEVVIIRPPLVYGPDAKGNFASLLKWIKRGVPLPLGAVHNQRSLLALDNLTDFIHLCITHPKAANETFLIADDEDVSTSELRRRVAIACGKRQCLLPVPVICMLLMAQLPGKSLVVDRLFGSLQIDVSKARQFLGWQPKITMQQQLESMASQAKSVESRQSGGFLHSRE